MKRLRQVLRELLIGAITVIILIHLLIGMLIWKLFRSEWFLMRLDDLIAWIDERWQISAGEQEEEPEP